MSFPGGLVVKSLPATAGDTGSIPGLGRSPIVGNGNTLQYCYLENSTDRGTYCTTELIVIAVCYVVQVMFTGFMPFLKKLHTTRLCFMLATLNFLNYLLNLLQYCFSFMFWFFCSWVMWDLSSQTRGWIFTLCIGRRSFNHWTTREVPTQLDI